MAIKIFCDLCGQEREINQIKGVETLGTGAWFNAPRMDHQHFICLECLEKIGWKEPANDKADKTDKTYRLDAGFDAVARDQQAVRKFRRRGVEVVLTWKQTGEFEVFTSITSAVERIAERTGTIVTGADISHALLKDRVYNADVFCVKYASERDELRIGTEGTETVNAEKAAGE